MAYKDPEAARAYLAKYRRENSAAIKARALSYRQRNPQKCREASRKWRATAEGKRKETSARYLREYGINLDAAEAMLVAQRGGCAICHDSIKLFSRLTHIDHCHTTRRVRGLLCQRCNLQLGNFEAWPDFHIYAALYLDRAHVV